MLRPFGLALGCFLVACLGACSPYINDFQYMPRPILAEIPATPPEPGPPLTVLASVIGVRREDAKEGIPVSVELRVRLDNSGTQAVVFSPQTLEMVNGTLVKFPAPLLHPGEPLTLAPAQSGSVTAFFPFPPGHSYDDTDLESLQVRWMVQIGGRNVAQVVNFRRVYRLYADPYWDYGPYPHYGGVVVIRRR